MKREKHEQRKVVSLDEEVPVRARIRELAEGTIVTILMMVVTIYAFIGDDFRNWFCGKAADPWFFGGLCFSLVAFTLEIMVNSCVVDDFKWSFFFWLDIIATASIILDIEWITNLAQVSIGARPSSESVNVELGTQQGQNQTAMKLTKIFKSLRLIRLIRIIKLYKYAIKAHAQHEDAKMREKEKASANALQAKLKRELEPNRLGKALSDTLTRTLIIGVLLLLMVLPALSFATTDSSLQYGLRQLFWFGRSNCNVIGGEFHCSDKVDWVTEEGWQSLLRGFVRASSPSEEEGLKPVLWMFVPDYQRNGWMSEIRNITNQFSDNQQTWDDLEMIRNVTRDQFRSGRLTDKQSLAVKRLQNNRKLFDTLETSDQQFKSLVLSTQLLPDQTSKELNQTQFGALQLLKRNDFPGELYWRTSQNCSGFIVNDNLCELRSSEMQLITYQPKDCEHTQCKSLVSYVRVDVSQMTKQRAILQFLTTIFTGLVIVAGALMFADDTQKIVIVPITKMVSIIKTLADDPLQKPERPVFDETDSMIKGNNMKTTELQKTIFRIGNLLQMSFGQLGASVIKENSSQGDGNFEIMIPGHRINVIFMVCKVNQFIEIADGLQNHITQYLNRVVGILHECAGRWDGQANRSDGETYLLTWKLPNTDNIIGDNDKNELILQQKTEMADKSLIAAVKIVSELRRTNKFEHFYSLPSMQDRFGTQHRPYVTFGLHMGYTIEGAIGSDFKIDACYLSANVQISYRVETLCKFYEMQILLTEPLYNLMSLKARNTLRKIDVITMKEQKDPMGLYTFDLSFNNIDQPELSQEHRMGDLIKLQQYQTINIESFKNKGVDYMFTLDSDIVGLQQHIQEFAPLFRQAFKCYIQGEWLQAFDSIERCLELWDNDGPTKALQLYMSYFSFQMPETWSGYRNIDEEIVIAEDQPQIEQKKED